MRLHRQQKIAFLGITKSQKTKLFAEIVVATLLIGIFFSPATIASPSAIATIKSSGTISASSALSGVLGYTDATYGSYGSNSVSMGDGDAAYVIPLITPCNMTVTELSVEVYGASGDLVPVIYSSLDGGPNTLLYTGSSTAWSTDGWTNVAISDNLVGGTTYWFGILINGGAWAYGTDQSTSGTVNDYIGVTYPDPPTTFGVDTQISATLSLYVNYTATSAKFAPEFASSANFNQLLAGETTAFSIGVSDWTNIVNYIFDLNGSNSSITSISNPSTSLTLTSTVTIPSAGNTVTVQWFAEGSDGSWASSSVFTFKAVNASPSTSLSLHTSGTLILNNNNQQIYLNDVGIESFAPSNIWWGSSGSDNWGDQWQTGAALNTSLNQEFENLSVSWHVDMVRVFFYSEWWWQGNVTPNTTDPGDGYSSTPINVRLYFQILCQIAGEYGIYVDICPYQLTAQTGAYAHDPYLDAGGGVPMTGEWDSTQLAFLASTGFATEQEFWTAFWAGMANSLRAYPNAIFEAWNEPADQDTSPNVITPAYLSYLTTMYAAIRGTGSTNLIFMQYQVGWEPNGWGENLNWASQITSAIGSPTNLAFTTHIYYYSPSDLTPYWDQNGVDNDVSGAVPLTEAQIAADFSALQSSMGVSTPLVFNEAGDCSYYTANIANDYIWWNNVCQAAHADGIGMSAYYFARWITNGGLGYVNLGVIATAPYSPNTFGQEFIDDIVPTS